MIFKAYELIKEAMEMQADNANPNTTQNVPPS